MRTQRRLVIALVAAVLATAPALAAKGYLQQPDLHGESVAFVAEADLWIASTTDGSRARRLTSHQGLENYPSFSPDGRTIAFSARYDGNPDVYVVAAGGGEPRRLTWHPSSDLVVGWTPDGTEILFRSDREHPHGSAEIFAVPVAGGDARKLPLGWVTHLDIDPQSGSWAFTRTGGGGTWKRYRGGSARSIWVGHPDREDFREVTDFEGMNAFPMWHDGRIYYLGDAGGTANLWSMLPDGDDHVRHTAFGDWDARRPAMGPDGRIVFMLAGGIHLFDPASGVERELTIELPSDRVLTRSRYPKAASYITWFNLSSDGERLALTTRGEIFSVPVNEGVTLPVTRGSGARESWATFDPEGKRLLYVTDEPREEEIRIVDAWGRGEPEVVLPAGEVGWHHPPIFSPDGKQIAYADHTQTLYVIAAKGGKPRVVDRAAQDSIEEYVWSPDSRWLAYAKLEQNDYGSIHIYDTQNETIHRLTGNDTDDHAPAWDPDGRFLYFLGNRNTNPLLGTRDLENVNIRPTLLYMALLRSDVENPFLDRAGLPPTKEAKEEDDESPDGEESSTKDEAPKPVEIEFDGLSDRIVALPVEAGQYVTIDATSSHVFYLAVPMTGMADEAELFSEPEPEAELHVFDLESKESETFAKGISGFSLAASANRVALMKSKGKLYVVKASRVPDDLSESRVSLSGVVVELDPLEEWEQIYHEAWRHMRDFYWDAGLAGVDWKRVRDQYAQLLPRLASRDDLRDLIAEMIAELSTSHTYVFGGDRGQSVPGRPTGLLGADLARAGDVFRVERIYRGAPADNEPSPLLGPGVNVQEGDYILAINHLPFDAHQSFHAHLEGHAGSPILLTVNDEPDTKGARQVVVEPLHDESGLRYADWVRRNRERVAEATDGKIGYLHIPDMMADGMIEFNTWFYPQLDKQGMIVDVRWNGGGFVSQMILDRFRRPIVSFDRARGGRVSTYPARVLNGPFVVLTDEHAGSDGDIFPYAVQLEGLAPVIGKRSWGGVVGISSMRQMVDGGLVTQPESAWWDPRDGWALENRGVDPDIEVQNLPQDLAKGLDAQLERGIEEVMRLHRANPPIEPEFGPVRPRDRDDYRGESASGGS